MTNDAPGLCLRARSIAAGERSIPVTSHPSLAKCPEKNPFPQQIRALELIRDGLHGRVETEIQDQLFRSAGDATEIGVTRGHLVGAYRELTLSGSGLERGGRGRQCG